MPTTSKGLRYPASSAAPNIPQDIQNLATDVTTALPNVWVTAYSSSTSYTYTPGSLNTWTTMLGTVATTPAIAVGRNLEVEASLPCCNAGGGFLYVRLTTGGVQRDTATFTACWASAKLTWDEVGTGAAVSIAVQAQVTTSDASVSATGGGAVRLRYRIV